MLDTNLWSYVGDAAHGKQLYEEVSRRGFEVVVPPSVLLELARTPNVRISERHVTAILSGSRKQLCSEAELVCDEFIDEVRRVRPDWLLRRSDPGSVRDFHRFWQVEIWRHARKDWPGLVAHLRERGLADGTDDANLETQRHNKEALRESDVRLDLNDLWMSVTEDAHPKLRELWPSGQPVEAWRGQTWITNRIDLHSYAQAEHAGDPEAWRLRGATMTDWLRVAVDTQKMLADEVGFARSANRRYARWHLHDPIHLNTWARLNTGR
jgi:hypothetical protein